MKDARRFLTLSVLAPLAAFPAMDVSAQAPNFRQAIVVQGAVDLSREFPARGFTG